MSNPIEEALVFAYQRAVVENDEPPEWTPEFAMEQMFGFCDEVRAIEGIITNALEAGDVKMLARAAAQLQHSSVRQFGGLSSVITFTAGKEITEGPGPTEVESKGKYENLFEALVKLDLVQGDIDGGRASARMTDMMHEWVAERHVPFMYLMQAMLRDSGWSEETLAKYSAAEAPDLNVGLMEDLDEELLSLFARENPDDDEDEE